MSWDIELFRLLNRSLVHPWLDALMPGLTSSATYRLPLLILALWVLVRGPARLRWIVLGLALCVGVSDLVSSQILKPLFGRLRPSWTLAEVRLLIGAKSSWSLPSSHAANLAAATWYLHRSVRAPWLSSAMCVALLLISYSRIYVGVHYPSDVLVGMLIGAAVAEPMLRLRFVWRQGEALAHPPAPRSAAVAGPASVEPG